MLIYWCSRRGQTMTYSAVYAAVLKQLAPNGLITEEAEVSADVASGRAVYTLASPTPAARLPPVPSLNMEQLLRLLTVRTTLTCRWPESGLHIASEIKDFLK